jgi:glutamine amidotransferase
MRNRMFNVDGFGLAWYTSAREEFGECKGQRPLVYRSARPPMHDSNFQNICANTTSKALFAHVRAATALSVVPVNNHPFQFGRHIFMHNGFLQHFLEISRGMRNLMDDDTYGNIQGTTDSEHFAALYMTLLTGGKGRASWELEYPVQQMKETLLKTVEIVVKMQKDKFGPSAAANSLNIAVTDGSVLVAMRFRNHKTEQPPSLYYSSTAGTTMNRKYPDHPDGKENTTAYKDPKEHGKHVIVASEPSTYKEKEWELIPKNHCIFVEKDGRIELEAIPYPEEYNAVASAA